MTSTRRAPTTITAAVLFGLTLAGVITAVAASVLSGLSLAQLDGFFVPTNAAISLSLAVAGWPIATYRPGNRVGWLLLGGGCSYASTAAGIPLLRCVANAGWHGPLWRVVATVTNGGWTWALTLFIPLTLLLFPDGGLLSRRWRWLFGVIAVNALAFAALGVGAGESASAGVAGYLTASERVAGQLSWVSPLTTVATLVTYVSVAVCIVLRFRRGADRVRRQLLWVMLALLLVVVLACVSPLLPDTDLTIFPLALIPLSILVAIFRYQLLDIRLVFSRSVLYLLLTAAAIGAYLAVVGALGQLLSAQVALGPSVVATLLIAVAFNPFRVWLQRRVDRAVYGARQDPVRAMAEVGARLGEVGTPAGAGLDGVLEALCQVMRLPSAAIVARGTQHASYGQAPAVLHSTPLRHGEEQLGELIVGLRHGEPRLDPADERVLGLLAAPIAVAAHASELASELSQSRQRVISGREEERRRLRRDLHDGLGPVLTGVALNAEAALRLVRHDPARSETLLGELRDQATGALADIRRLVYGLRPPALDSMGLAGALREYATVLSRRAGAAPLMVSVDVPEPLGDLPAAAEVAAYRIVTEGLANVTRHSSAATAVVTLTVGDGELHVAVHDDGMNVGGGYQPGVGLTSIRERAAELGGRCTIQLDRTGGRIDVHLPLPSTTRAGRLETPPHQAGMQA
jgi:two-component system NarL family sensor kinase